MRLQPSDPRFKSWRLLIPSMAQTSKIEEVCCYRAALDRMYQDFARSLPVYVRGIASSRGPPITLPHFTQVSGDVIVRGIEQIVENGTELEMDKTGVLVDRPLETVPEGIVTRVSQFPGMYMMMVEQALLNLERFALSHLEERTRLVPTLLVYDPEQVIFTGGVNIILPHDREARQASLLKAYLLENVLCREKE